MKICDAMKRTGCFEFGSAMIFSHCYLTAFHSCVENESSTIGFDLHKLAVVQNRIDLIAATAP